MSIWTRVSSYFSRSSRPTVSTITRSSKPPSISRQTAASRSGAAGSTISQQTSSSRNWSGGGGSSRVTSSGGSTSNVAGQTIAQQKVDVKVLPKLKVQKKTDEPVKPSIQTKAGTGKVSIEQQKVDTSQKKNIEKELKEKGYSEKEIKEFLKQVEDAPAGTTYKLEEKTVNGETSINLISQKPTVEKRAEDIIKTAGTKEKMVLYGSTAYSKRGIELVAKTLIKGKETPDDVIKRHIMDAQTKDRTDFIKDTAVGSVYGSASGLAATSIFGGALTTSITKSAAAVSVASKYPQAVMVGKGIGLGAKVGYVGIKGVQLHQAREDPQKIGEILLRTGIEYGGFKLGAKAQQDYITSKQPPKVSVSVSDQDAVVDKQLKQFEAKADTVAKSGDQTVTSKPTIKGTYGDEGQYSGTYKDPFETIRERPELSSRAGETVYQVRSGEISGGFGGHVQKIGTDPVTNRPVYLYNQRTIGKVDKGILDSIQQGLARDVFTTEPEGLAITKINGENFIFTKTDYYKVGATGVTWVGKSPLVSTTSKPTTDISTSDLRVYEKASPEWVKNVGIPRYQQQSGGGITYTNIKTGLKQMFSDVGTSYTAAATEGVTTSSISSTTSKLIQPTSDTSLLSGIVTTTASASTTSQQQELELKPLTKSGTKTIQEPTQEPVTYPVQKQLPDVSQKYGQAPITVPIQIPIQSPIQDQDTGTSTITEPTTISPVVPVAPQLYLLEKTATPPVLAIPDFFDDDIRRGRYKRKTRKSIYSVKVHNVLELPEFIGVGKSKKKSKRRKK